MHILITRLDPTATLPTQAHDDDAGYDVYANVDALLLPGGGRALIPTGLALAIPSGYAGLVLPRSGLAMKHGITVMNAPGLIDPQYRGEIKVALINTDPVEPYAIQRGDRIAQLVIQTVAYVEWVEVDSLDVTTRDEFGFGSSGK